MKVQGYAAWKELFRFCWNFFSIGPLFGTLFVPYHREEFDASKSQSSVFERVVFDLIMRVLGATARVIIIISGIIALSIVFLSLPLFLILRLSVNSDKLFHHRALGRDLAFRWTPRLRRLAREISIGREVPLIGKKDALTRLEQVLARENQNNALIVGAPGVGRSTLVSQLAKYIAWGRTLPQLRYKRVFELSLNGLDDSGVRSVLGEAAAAGNVILVIDNIHAYSNIFDAILPFTEIPELRLIGITDFDNFHRVMKERTDLMQRFEKIEVEEPNESEIVSFLKAFLDSRGVSYDSEVPEEVVRLTNRLIMYVPQPEKSLDVLEELLARQPKHIGLNDIYGLVSSKTGVPVGQITDRERDILTHLEDLLRQTIVGQDEVIKEIAEALRRARSGVTAANRPIGSFLFLGPTGVGKTHTAKKLAAVYYGSENSMISIDMTEFSQESSLNEFAKRLVIAVEENPFTLILFDEIEKAHKAVLNLFLQILDEARLSDISGRRADFHNAFIISTSNAGSQLLIGNRNIPRDDFISALLRDGVFSPEFLNRFDDIFLFRPLSTDAAARIAGMLLDEFVERMREEKNLKIEYEKDLIVNLAKIAGNSIFGAREIRRLLEQTIESYVADKIIEGDLAPGDRILIPSHLISGANVPE